MTVLNILSYPDPILRKVSDPVVELTQDLKILIQDMKDTMKACGHAIGLSAIQVGHPVRIIIVDRGGGNLVEYINPEITESSGRYSVQEGCLSFPSVTDGILRYKCVVFRYDVFDDEGKLGFVEAEANDLLAVVIQHEIDHLNGILMYDHMTSIFQKKVDKIFRVKL